MLMLNYYLRIDGINLRLVLLVFHVELLFPGKLRLVSRKEGLLYLVVEAEASLLLLCLLLSFAVALDLKNKRILVVLMLEYVLYFLLNVEEAHFD